MTVNKKLQEALAADMREPQVFPLSFAIAVNTVSNRAGEPLYAKLFLRTVFTGSSITVTTAEGQTAPVHALSDEFRMQVLKALGGSTKIKRRHRSLGWRNDSDPKEVLVLSLDEADKLKAILAAHGFLDNTERIPNYDETRVVCTNSNIDSYAVLATVMQSVLDAVAEQVDVKALEPAVFAY